MAKKAGVRELVVCSIFRHAIPGLDAEIEAEARNTFREE